MCNNQQTKLDSYKALDEDKMKMNVNIQDKQWLGECLFPFPTAKKQKKLITLLDQWFYTDVHLSRERTDGDKNADCGTGSY